MVCVVYEDNDVIKQDLIQEHKQEPEPVLDFIQQQEPETDQELGLIQQQEHGQETEPVLDLIQEQEHELVFVTHDEKELCCLVSWGFG